MMSTETPFVGDFYDVLGVSRDASTDEIKKAFRKLARECHPDVAGDDPKAAERFNKVRNAYEILVDPIQRARYDRRGQPRQSRWGPDGFRMPGGFHFRTGREAAGNGGPRARRSTAQSSLDLEDIFSDFGNVADFGFGAQKGKAGGTAARQPGRDINMTVDVPTHTAEHGGTVTLRYPRLRRSNDGKSLHRYDEIYDLRVLPGTENGATLRVPRMGDAGNDGTADGDLVCDIRVVADTTGTRGAKTGNAGPPPPRGRNDPRERRRRSEPRPPRPARAEAEAEVEPEVQVVPISVGEALLGGRIAVDTPGGRVRLTVPACSSSGTRLRLKGKGTAGADLYIELRIVVPRRIDDDSVDLIEEFMVMNPYDPRDI